MNLHRVLGNIGAAAGSQGVSLIVSLVTSLLVPKVLGIEEFGYWQLFLFYFGFAGVFQIGLNDGVYLLKGGKSRNDLNKAEISSQLAFGFLFQSISATVVLAITIACQPPYQRFFVLVASAILMPLYNASCFFQYLFQAVDETRTYSKSIVLDRGFFLIALILLMVFRVDHFEAYVLAYAACKFIWLSYFLIKARSMLTRSLLPLKDAANISWASIRVGIKLMIANVASILILGIMRFFVDGCWGIEVFSKVSLALSMANFFLTFITQATMVLFPTLRKLDELHLKRFFESVQNALELGLPAVLLLYLPIKLMLSWWLPDYADSFMYLGLLLPLCLFDGKMSALYSTIFKVRRMESYLLVLNVTTMALSALLAAIGATVLKNLEFVLISGAMSVILRATASGAILSKKILGDTRIRFGEILLAAVFIFGSLTLPSESAVVVYLLAYCGYLVIEHKALKKMLLDIVGARKILREENGNQD